MNNNKANLRPFFAVRGGADDAGQEGPLGSADAVMREIDRKGAKLLIHG